MSGNAAVGLIAASQALDDRLPEATCSWPVPAALHAPIDQQVIMMTRARNKAAVREFLDYLASDAATASIERLGYRSGD